MIVGVLIVAAFGLPGRAFASAADYGYPYPNAPDCDEQTGAGCVTDQWGMVEGQCHSWVAYRLNQLNAAQLSGTFTSTYKQPSGQLWGGGGDWKPAALRAGLTVDDIPALGSVAWFSANGGHVAYVEALNSDGSVQISEMNVDFHNSFDFATLRRGQRWPDGFIHIADRPGPVQTNVPSAPTNVAASGADARAFVSWRAPASDGGSPVLGYAVTAYPGGSTATAPPSSTSATVAGLVNGNSYAFTVHATNAVGNSPESSPSNMASPAGPPDPPTNVRATASKQSASVSWNAPSRDNGATVTGYTIRVLGPSAQAKTVRVGAVSRVTITGLVNGATYTFDVAATNRAGTSATSVPSRPLTLPKAAPVVVPPVSTSATAGSGYWMLSRDGSVYAFGSAPYLGGVGAPGTQATQIVPWGRRGYYVLTGTQVRAFGGAPQFINPSAQLFADERVTSMSLFKSGSGYWLFTSRGRVFPVPSAAANARFFGDLSRVALTGPILGSVATPTGRGYYMVGSDGGVFAFGDARFYGSMGGRRLDKPIVALVPTADNHGYWLVASDGGVFAFGSAKFKGSMGGTPLQQPIVGMVRYGNGYLMVAADGGVFDFSSRPFAGSLGGRPPASPVVSIAAL